MSDYTHLLQQLIYCTDSKTGRPLQIHVKLEEQLSLNQQMIQLIHIKYLEKINVQSQL